MMPRFEIEGEIEDKIEEEEENRGGGVYLFLAVVILLFLVSASLLVYYQFYKGQGKFEWTMQKRNTIVADTITETYLKMQCDSSLAMLDSLRNAIQSSQSLFTKSTIGEVYYVQIGAFRKTDFTRYDSNLVNMFVDVSDGMNMLIIGGFLNINDACCFRKDMVRIGIEDAFVVKKVDGVRVKFDQWCE
jgi:hypothetical protein